MVHSFLAFFTVIFVGSFSRAFLIHLCLRLQTSLEIRKIATASLPSKPVDWEARAAEQNARLAAGLKSARRAVGALRRLGRPPRDPANDWKN
jgi:hypothetical protein